MRSRMQLVVVSCYLHQSETSGQGKTPTDTLCHGCTTELLTQNELTTEQREKFNKICVRKTLYDKSMCEVMVGCRASR